MLKLVWLVPVLPLVGAVALGILGRRLAERSVGIVACIVVAASFVAATGVVVDFASARWSQEQYTVYRSDEAGRGLPGSFVWIPGGAAVTADGRPVPGGVTLEWVYAVDALTCVLLIVVTGAGLLVHFFAVRSMRGDPGYARFFACLNLFMFSMLVLVLASNLPLLLVGWEGLGLCSYLLVGLRNERDEAASVATNAFVANRIGDAGFLLGMFGLFALFGTFELAALRDAVGAVEAERLGEVGGLGLVALGLYAGVMGMGAQIALSVWQPKATAQPARGPALVHTATVVTAGVYLLARFDVVFSRTPTATLAAVGAATALVGAAIATGYQLPGAFTVWLSRRANRFDERAVDDAVDGVARLTRRASLVTGWLDVRIVDGAVSLVAFALTCGSLLVRGAQNGLVQSYALAIVIGLVALAVVLEWRAIAQAISSFVGGGP